MHLACVKIEFLITDLHVGVLAVDKCKIFASKDLPKIINRWSIHCCTVARSDLDKVADHGFSCL